MLKRTACSEAYQPERPGRNFRRGTKDRGRDGLRSIGGYRRSQIADCRLQIGTLPSCSIGAPVRVICNLRSAICDRLARAAFYNAACASCRNRPRPRLRIAVHPADRTPRARARGLLRDPPVRHRSRSDPHDEAEGDHPLGRPAVRLRRRRPLLLQAGLRARHPDPRHLLRDAAHGALSGRQRRSGVRARVRPRRGRGEGERRRCSARRRRRRRSGRATATGSSLPLPDSPSRPPRSTRPSPDSRASSAAATGSSSTPR